MNVIRSYSAKKAYGIKKQSKHPVLKKVGIFLLSVISLGVIIYIGVKFNKTDEVNISMQDKNQTVVDEDAEKIEGDGTPPINEDQTGEDSLGAKDPNRDDAPNTDQPIEKEQTGNTARYELVKNQGKTAISKNGEIIASLRRQ